MFVITPCNLHHKICVGISCLQIEAEDVPSISQRYEIAAVPTCVILRVIFAFNFDSGASFSNTCMFVVEADSTMLAYITVSEFRFCSPNTCIIGVNCKHLFFVIFVCTEPYLPQQVLLQIVDIRILIFEYKLLRRMESSSNE